MKISAIQIGSLVALIGGFVLIGIGAYMMYTGIEAEGSIDLKSSLVSGSLKSGSAGLFLSFFGGLIVIASLISLRGSESSSTEVTAQKSGADKLLLFVLLLVCIRFAGAVYESLDYSGFATLNVTLSTAIMFLVGVIIASKWK